MRTLTDQEIDNLISDPKPLPDNWQNRMKLRPKKRYQYEERQIQVTSQNGRQFRLIARRNKQNLLDFSIILLFEDDDGSEYRLLRYNGKHPSRHTNRWERDRSQPNGGFGPNFHIHRATERYQRDGYEIDGFAEVTNSYGDFGSALDEFLDNCASVRPGTQPPRLL